MKIFSGFLFIVCTGLFAYAVIQTTDGIPLATAADPACVQCHDNYGDHTGESGHLLVECKDCHGVPDPSLSIEQTHEQLFKPGMEQFDSPDFCLRCHKK